MLAQTRVKGQRNGWRPAKLLAIRSFLDLTDLRWGARRGRYMRIMRPYVATRTYMLPAWVFHSRLIPIAACSS
jgi:hypothetical protein